MACPKTTLAISQRDVTQNIRKWKQPFLNVKYHLNLMRSAIKFHCIIQKGYLVKGYKYSFK